MKNREPSKIRFAVALLFGLPLLLVFAVAVPARLFSPANSTGSLYEYPVLPAAHHNYANIPLPNHYLFNGFPKGTPGQNAPIDNDNTPADNPTTNAGATLGRVLFYDKKLSANRTTACASCHRQELGFSDDGPQSTGFDGINTRRHSMSLANARFYEAGKAFWDERAASLEDQALRPIQDPVEMGLTLAELVHIVGHQPYYESLFVEAFGDSVVTSERIAKAIAQFERSMVSVNSKYDAGRAMVNSPLVPFPNFTPLENQGKALFMSGKPGGPPITCVACHVSEAFISPARFSNDPNITTDTTNNGLVSVSTIDFGVQESTGNPADDFKFKVPSLRNIAVTGPYMHDGGLATLEEVVDFYSTRIRPHPNLDPRLRAPGGEPVQFNFTTAEKSALIAFMNTLTDFTLLTGEKYSDPFVQATALLGTKFLDGVIVGGTTADLGDSDNQLLEVDPSPTSNPYKQKIDVIVVSSSPTADPATFKLLLESTLLGDDPNDVQLRIEMYNFTNNSWDLMESRTATQDDEFVEVDLSDSAEDYLHPIHGEIAAKVSWRSDNFSGKPFFWSVDIDTLVWVIE